MGLIQRLTGYLKSNLNDILTRSENPEIMLDQLIWDMKGAFVKARDEVKEAIMEQKRLESEAALNMEKASEWDEKAIEALEIERPELAKKCLQKKRNFEKLSASLEKTAKEQKSDVESLKKDLSVLKAKLEEAKEKKMMLLAAGTVRKQKERRSKSGEPRLQVDLSPFEKFEQMEAKINLAELEIDAVKELDPDLLCEDDELENELKELEDNEIEKALKELREKAGTSGSTPNYGKDKTDNRDKTDKKEKANKTDKKVKEKNKQNKSEKKKAPESEKIKSGDSKKPLKK
jgi:phage shock protein A